MLFETRKIMHNIIDKAFAEDDYLTILIICCAGLLIIRHHYAIYKKLIFAALNLGVATADDFKWVVNHGHYSDAKKVMAIVNQHVPDPLELPKSLKKVYVYDCYKFREVLKGLGYKYNSVDSSWFEEFQDSEVETELEFLTAIGDKKDVDVVDAQKVHLRPHNYVIVSGNTYSCKDILKSLGYFFSAKDKTWKKEVEKYNLETEAAKLKNISGIKVECR